MKKTVFVVGAGASHEFGMPLGSGLVSLIRAALSAEETTHGVRPLTAAAMASGLGGDFGAAARDIAAGMISAMSIDRYLESRKEDPLIRTLGKIAIAYHIATQESATGIGRIDGRDWGEVQRGLERANSTWLASLFRLLHQGIPKAEAARVFQDVAFVTFNYDRMIEAYIHLALSHIMSLGGKNAADLVAQIPIVHVYGQLESSIDFGSRIFPEPDGGAASLLHLSQPLRTFTEQHDEDVLTRAHALIREAEAIVLLGFAFDRLNVEAIFPDPLLPGQHVYATSYGAAPHDVQNFLGRVGGAHGSRMLEPKKAADLVNDLNFGEYIGLR